MTAPPARPVAPAPSGTPASAAAEADARLARSARIADALGVAGVEIGGFLHAQGQLDQQSQDQLMQGGALLNQDGFVVRRARLAVARHWRTAALALELDANTVRGANITLRRAEASVFWAGETPDAPPLAAIALGLTDIPFGYEMLESSRDRLFMERSLASLAFFPGEPDIGARAWGGYGPFRYAVALLAGEPINERVGTNRADPNQAKDLLGRVGIDTAPSRDVVIAGGVSVLVGTGFHAGTDATKDALTWRDLNENGAIELGELTSVPGVAATPSENFGRWAIGADLQLGFRTRAGWTRISAEVTVASNLDRGIFVADPVVAGHDLRHLGAYVAVVQDQGRFFGGARVDYYDPNLDALDERGGSLIPFDETITTITGLAGVRLPHQVRVSLQYERVLDSLARDARGVPADLANDRVIARLQVEL